MYNSIFTKIIIAAGAFAILSVAALWSFNALSELFGGPQAQYQHAIAAIALLLVLRWSLTTHRRADIRTRISHRHRRDSESNACAR
jgi:uncharacterized membrane protein YgdD (TMEM256/DUF423 family)